MMAASDNLESAGLALSEAAEGDSRGTFFDEEEEDDALLSFAMAKSISDQNDKEDKELQEALRLIQEQESQGYSAGATASQSLPPSNTVSRESTSHSSLEETRVASRKTYSFEELREQDAEYRDIKEAFDAVGVKITRVRKVINASALKKFEFRFFEMESEKPKGFDLNIQHLYHGTTAPEGQVCLEGFDSRLGKKGHFGVGVYFSDNPKKCVQFMSRSGPGTGSTAEPYILRCRVILGDIKEYPPGAMDDDLKREPIKETLDGRNFYYDSVKGMPNRDGLNEFIIYEGRSALIEHVINYDPRAKVDRSSSSSVAAAAAAAAASNIQNSSTARSATQPSLTSRPTSSENTFSLNVAVRNPAPEGTNLESGNARVPSTPSVQNDPADSGENASRSADQMMNVPSSVAEEDSHSDNDYVDATDGTVQGAAPASSQQTSTATAEPKQAGAESHSDDNPAGEDETDGTSQRAVPALSQQRTLPNPATTATILEPQRALTPLEKAESLTLKIAATSADPDMKEKLGQIEAQLRANVIGGPALSSQLLDAFEKTYIDQTLDQADDTASAKTDNPSGENGPSNSEFQVPLLPEEEDPMEELMNYQLNEFLTITESSDLEEAKRFLALANMDIETAVTLYLDTKQAEEG